MRQLTCDIVLLKEDSTMKNGLSDQIRRVAKEKYVDPAVRSGRKEFSIPVRGMLDSLSSTGFPKNHTPQVCHAIQTAKFLSPNGIEVERVEGPPSGQSSTVVVHYRVLGAGATKADKPELDARANAVDAEARARRLAGDLRGLLRKELAEYGGAEGFVRWIRSDDKEAA
jgi:hypothetical protein